MDLEAEDQNDNLSDMISANVSGRGTPNISGKTIMYFFSLVKRERDETPSKLFVFTTKKKNNVKKIKTT